MKIPYALLIYAKIKTTPDLPYTDAPIEQTVRPA